MREKLICYDCINESYLKQSVLKDGEMGICSFCGENLKGFTLETMAELIDVAFEHHFEMSFPEPPNFRQEGVKAVTAIMNATGVPENAAEQIREILEEDYYDFDAAAIEAIPFGSDAYYVEKTINVDHLEKRWREFEETLKKEARFFNTKGYDLLESIFEQISHFSTLDSKSAIVTVGPGTNIEHIYRARSFQSLQKLKIALTEPVKELGPPPSEYALSGRMNADGISVFYGSLEQRSAVAEVRPPVGSEVAVAKFNIMRNLNLLDLTAFPKIIPEGSIFDPIFTTTKSKIKFLKNLSDQMAIPIMPEAQSKEYLVTQAIADYLSGKEEFALDGIIYPSVQSSKQAKNVILFHKSARVKSIVYDVKTEITADLGRYSSQGWIKKYSITETRTMDESIEERKIREWAQLSGLIDHRNPTLEIDVESITIHEIKPMTYPTTAYKVRYEVKKELQKKTDNDWLAF